MFGFNTKITFQSLTLDGQLDEVLPYVAHESEDVREREFYAVEGGKAWMEFSDSERHLEAVKHYFYPGGLYILSVNGNVSRGQWWPMAHGNKINILLGDAKQVARDEIYELVFLNSTFFILRKDGEAESTKYLVLGDEQSLRHFTWSEYVELLYEAHRKRTALWVYFALAAVLVVVVGVLSC